MSVTTWEAAHMMLGLVVVTPSTDLVPCEIRLIDAGEREREGGGWERDKER